MLSQQYLSGARPALNDGLYSSPGLSTLITGQEREDRVEWYRNGCYEDPER